MSFFKKTNLLIVGLLTLVINLSINNTTHGATITSNYKDLTVQITPPKQQIGASPYLNLVLPSKDNTTISFKVTNKSNKNTTVNLIPYNATTNNLRVKYDQTKGVWNNNTKLTDMLSNEVTDLQLKAHESKLIKFKVTGHHIKNMILGGIKVSEGNNKHGIISAIVIKNKNRLISTNLHFRLTNFNISHNKKKVSFNTTFMNDGDLIANTKISETIMKDGKKIATFKRNNGSLAPNSAFTINAPYNSHSALTAGKYTIVISINSHGDINTYRKSVTMSKNSVNAVTHAMNLKDSNQKKVFSINYFLIVCLLIVIGVIGYIIYDLLKNKEK